MERKNVFFIKIQPVRYSKNGIIRLQTTKTNFVTCRICFQKEKKPYSIQVVRPNR